MSENKLPTINDVADVAGVSKRTVSRVINNSDKVNEATRQRVQQAIEELNFSPNRQARGLAASRSYLLGLVYDAPTLFVNEIQTAMLSVCENSGYEVVVHRINTASESLVDGVVQFINRANLDGVLIAPPISENDELFERLDQMNCQYMRFKSGAGGTPIRQMVSDYKPALTEMTNHLVELGHQNFGHITGPANHVSSRMRREIFVEALRSHGLSLPPAMIARGAFTFESGVIAAEQLLTGRYRPTAIFAANDEMAFGVMKVANEMGLSIPRDLSLVGFDGTPFSTFVVPALSTVIRKTDEMAQIGTRKLLALINEGPEAASQFEHMVSPRFVPRGSTGPAPASTSSRN